MARRIEALSRHAPIFGVRELALDVPRAIGLAVVTAGLIAAIGTSLFVSTFYGKVIPGVRVDGVPIGGLPPDSASTALVGRAQRVGDTRIELRADSQIWQPTLADLGVQIDARSLADRAYRVGRVGSPLERSMAIGSALFHPIDLTAPSLDRTRLAAWVNDSAGSFDRTAMAANLEIAPSGVVRLTPETNGRQLDRGGAVQALGDALDAWLGKPGSSPPASIDLPFTTQPAAVRAAELAPVRAQAEAALARPLTVKLDEKIWRLDRPDLAKLLSIRRDGTTAAVDVDRTALGALVERMAVEAERRSVNASMQIGVEGSVVFNGDTSGRQVDRAAAAEQLRAALVQAGGSATTELHLPAAQIPATVRAADLADARKVAERALAGPIKLVAGDRSATLRPNEVAAMLRLNSGSGAVRVELDDAKLKAVLETLAAEAERAPRNAHLRVVGGSGARPSWLIASMPNGGPDAKLEAIDEGAPGQHLDVAKALDAARRGLLESPARTIDLPVDARPAYGAASRDAFGPLEYIDGSSTSYAGSIPERAHNIELAASRLDGYVVAPGATFSFNQAVGSTSVDNGYQVAWGIMGAPSGGARTVPSVGGGICQVATTLFHAVFWSGYQIEERNWHLYWIPKYGAPPRGLQGLDATVDEDSGVDLKWTNNTDSPVLIQARTDGSQISFALYGKKPAWQVAVSQPVIDGWVRANTAMVRQAEPTMAAVTSLFVEEARDGFRSTIVRKVTMPNAEPRVLTLSSVYQPSRNVMLFGTGGKGVQPGR